MSRSCFGLVSNGENFAIHLDRDGPGQDNKNDDCGENNKKHSLT